MKIHVISPCRNEEKLLPYYLRHYTTFCDQITIYDGHSTDKSIEIIKSFPKTRIIEFDDGKFNDESTLMSIKNEKYKDDRKWDWQIVCDIDEILYCTNLIQRLESYKEQGITVPWTQGWDMYSSVFPETDGQIYEAVKYGIKNEAHESKSLIFNPEKITINYGIGCHHASPSGQVKYSAQQDLKVLHLKYLSYEYYLERLRNNVTRHSEENKKHGWGSLQTQWLNTTTRDMFDKLQNQTERIIA